MKIGIIGENGVATTNRPCDMVERKTTNAGDFRDMHHPEMAEGPVK
jgi:aspartate racemase